MAPTLPTDRPSHRRFIPDTASAALVNFMFNGPELKVTSQLTTTGYIVEKHVERARVLLECGHASISEAALDGGFCDQSPLARGMREVLGISPSDLRD